MANSIDRVKQSIRERLEEIETERDQLMRALEALTDTPTPAGGRRGRPPGSGGGRAGGGGKRAGARRARRGQRREQVISALQGGEMGPSAIAQQIGGVNPTQISGLLRQLAADGVVTKTDGGKWALTGASHQQQAPDPSPSEESAATGTSDSPSPARAFPS